ncbi:uncharacterized protein LOC112198964 [Rosa chinensis]|uniref:uncharacterized protein LOC112198964 n=1 Tax=Rosa chinensis TaxID=74649 RepID=UPI000D096202|nr:uncharacterized protein LOC112198964 [Rosa chinensis]
MTERPKDRKGPIRTGRFGPEIDFDFDFDPIEKSISIRLKIQSLWALLQSSFQVCEKLAAQLHHQVENKRAEVEPKKISEYQIIEITENVCNLKKAEVDWILLIDIVEQGDKLQVRICASLLWILWTESLEIVFLSTEIY